MTSSHCRDLPTSTTERDTHRPRTGVVGSSASVACEDLRRQPASAAAPAARRTRNRARHAPRSRRTHAPAPCCAPPPPPVLANQAVFPPLPVRGLSRDSAGEAARTADLIHHPAHCLLRHPPQVAAPCPRACPPPRLVQLRVVRTLGDRTFAQAVQRASRTCWVVAPRTAATRRRLHAAPQPAAPLQKAAPRPKLGVCTRTRTARVRREARLGAKAGTRSAAVRAALRPRRLVPAWLCLAGGPVTAVPTPIRRF